jgi:hypothetical protein
MYVINLKCLQVFICFPNGKGMNLEANSSVSLIVVMGTLLTSALGPMSLAHYQLHELSIRCHDPHIWFLPVFVSVGGGGVSYLIQWATAPLYQACLPGHRTSQRLAG